MHERVEGVAALVGRHCARHGWPRTVLCCATRRRCPASAHARPAAGCSRARRIPHAPRNFSPMRCGPKGFAYAMTSTRTASSTTKPSALQAGTARAHHGTRTRMREVDRGAAPPPRTRRPAARAAALPAADTHRAMRRNGGRAVGRVHSVLAHRMPDAAGIGAIATAAPDVEGENAHGLGVTVHAPPAHERTRSRQSPIVASAPATAPAPSSPLDHLLCTRFGDSSASSWGYDAVELPSREPGIANPGILDLILDPVL